MNHLQSAMWQSEMNQLMQQCSHRLLHCQCDWLRGSLFDKGLHVPPKHLNQVVVGGQRWTMSHHEAQCDITLPPHQKVSWNQTWSTTQCLFAMAKENFVNGLFGETISQLMLSVHDRMNVNTFIGDWIAKMVMDCIEDVQCPGSHLRNSCNF